MKEIHCRGIRTKPGHRRSSEAPGLDVISDSLLYNRPFASIQWTLMPKNQSIILPTRRAHPASVVTVSQPCVLCLESVFNMFGESNNKGVSPGI
jgi:hypothetical protein